MKKGKRISTFSLMNKPLLFLTIGLFVFGLFMILSASSMESYMRYGKSPYYYFFKQGCFFVAGIVASLVVIKIPTKTYKFFSKFLAVLPFILLILTMVFGKSVHNAKSWIMVGPVSLQLSEFIKVILIIYFGVYYEKNSEKMDNSLTLLIPMIITFGVFCLIAIQPDLGTGSIVMLLTGLIFYSIPMKKEHKSAINKILIGGILVVALVLLATGGSILKGYQKDRLNFFDPCERYQDQSGYQLCNSFIALHNGGLTGQGIGKSTQKYLYLPEGYTDFIFPIIVEEWGLIVGIILILLLGVVLIQIYNISKNSSTLRNSIISYGVFVYIFLHICVNLGGVLGLLPLTGVPLPFLSYGGSFGLSLMVALSLVQRVNIENNLEKIRKLKSENN